MGQNIFTKTGANVMDQNKIKKFAAAGKSVKEIARILKVNEKTVAKFVAHFKKIEKAK